MEFGMADEDDLFVELAKICAPTGGSGDDTFILSGLRLRPVEVAELEESIANEPDDLKSRLKLLGYYSTHQFDSRKASRARHRHILWMIDRRPTDYVTGSHWCTYVGTEQEKNCAQAKAHWSRAIAAHPTNAQILANAAAYYFLNDKDSAETLLAKARLLDPENPKWPKQLERLYMLWRISSSKSRARVYAARALFEGEEYLRLEQNLHARYLRIANVGWTAFLSGDCAKARYYANLSLETGKQLGYEIESAQCTHDAQVLLGCVCLVEDDIKGAKAHLLAAAPIKMRDTLDSVRPNMTLAKALLDRGQKGVVLQFLGSCSDFAEGRSWKNGVATVKKWIAAIHKGRIPRFKDGRNDYVRQ
jgi:hypothetical protein